MASIQTNWAYVKGLLGSYHDGTNLVESAITVRRRLGQARGEAATRGACAARSTVTSGGSSWPGSQIRRPRDLPGAAKLVLARSDLPGAGDLPVPGRAGWRHSHAVAGTSRTGKTADHAGPGHLPRPNIRGYPSALNRAGRIFGRDDIDIGLNHLAEGIEWARV